jgi:hypothetical protein
MDHSPARPCDLRGRARVVAFVAWAAAVVVYYALRTRLPDLPFWWDVALLVFPIIPGVLALVWLALPLRDEPELVLLGGAVVCGLAAWGLQHYGYGLPANFAKLAAPTLAGWWFLGYFENVGWVVLVACIIPFVDSYSVFWGPTNDITKHHFHVYSSVAFAFVVPNHSAAQIGPPDVLFFALFLAAAARFGLRVPLTFALTALSFGATVVIANGADVSGLPALPLLSLGFLGVNADLLWARRRRARAPAQR